MVETSRYIEGYFEASDQKFVAISISMPLEEFDAILTMDCMVEHNIPLN